MSPEHTRYQDTWLCTEPSKLLGANKRPRLSTQHSRSLRQCPSFDLHGDSAGEWTVCTAPFCTKETESSRHQPYLWLGVSLKWNQHLKSRFPKAWGTFTIALSNIPPSTPPLTQPRPLGSPADHCIPKSWGTLSSAQRRHRKGTPAASLCLGRVASVWEMLPGG
jgi:hypothetical protein